jgi:hypothetical protein
VLKMMKDEGFGFMYKISIEGKELHVVVYSFVDDTDIIQSGQPGEPVQVLVTRMQAAMDPWEGGLIHAGAEALGAGLPHLFTVQYIAHLSTLVCYSPGGYVMSLLLWAAM